MRSANTAHLEPHAHPAHALLSVAHALLTPASAITAPSRETTRADTTHISVLPIEEVSLPAPDVTDFRDVVDAINRLCDTMKTSYDYEEPLETAWVGSELVAPEEVIVRKVETHRAETWHEAPQQIEELTGQSELISDVYYTASSDVSLQSDSDISTKYQDVPVEEEGGEWPTISNAGEMYHTCSDVSLLLEPDVPKSLNKTVVKESKEHASTGNLVEEYYTSSDMSLLSDSDIPLKAHDSLEKEAKASLTIGNVGEVYYSASSDISLISESDVGERCQGDQVEKERKECVIAGHVAAMRERFESMTRTNTPCPDLIRSTSPSLEVYRITPSPDKLD